MVDALLPCITATSGANSGSIAFSAVRTPASAVPTITGISVLPITRLSTSLRSGVSITSILPSVTLPGLASGLSLSGLTTSSQSGLLASLPTGFSPSGLNLGVQPTPNILPTNVPSSQPLSTPIIFLPLPGASSSTSNPLTNLPGLPTPTQSTPRISTLSATRSPTTLSIPTATAYPLIACPLDTGLNYITPSGRAYRITCSTTYPGPDLSSTLSPNLQTCIDSCSMLQTCAGITYEASTRTCVYKSAIGGTTGTPNAAFAGAVEVDLSCPNSNGGQYVDAFGAEYRILCNVTFPSAVILSNNLNIGGNVDTLFKRQYPAYSIPPIIPCSNQCSNLAGCVAVTEQDDACIFIRELGATAQGSTVADTVVMFARRRVVVNENGNAVIATSAVTSAPMVVATGLSSGISGATIVPTTNVGGGSGLPGSTPIASLTGPAVSLPTGGQASDARPSPSLDNPSISAPTIALPSNILPSGPGAPALSPPSISPSSSHSPGVAGVTTGLSLSAGIPTDLTLPPTGLPPEFQAYQATTMVDRRVQH